MCQKPDILKRKTMINFLKFSQGVHYAWSGNDTGPGNTGQEISRNTESQTYLLVGLMAIITLSKPSWQLVHGWRRNWLVRGENRDAVWAALEWYHTLAVFFPPLHKDRFTVGRIAMRSWRSFWSRCPNTTKATTIIFFPLPCSENVHDVTPPFQQRFYSPEF